METARNTCGCCEGIGPVTPESVLNRPGLGALRYRVGTHPTFLESMLARLSSHRLPPPADGEAPSHPLGALTTRDSDDFSIALLDAWATVADVLTFYQERIANEGFLRTAVERRSVLELARLIGYRLRPGVAATAWLALELDDGYVVSLPPHAIQARSVPGPDETPQTFENVAPIEARADWNRLGPRLSQPQTLSSVLAPSGAAGMHARLYVQGISTDVKRGDVVLVTVDEAPAAFLHVATVEKDAVAERTLLTFEEASAAATAGYRISCDAISAALGRITERAGRGLSDTGTHAQVIGLLQRMRRVAEIDYADAVRAAEALQSLIDALGEVAPTEDEPERGADSWLNAARDELGSVLETVLADASREHAAAFVRAANPAGGMVFPDPTAEPLRNVIAGLTKRPAPAPRGPESIDRDLSRALAQEADTGLQLIAAFAEGIDLSLPAALAETTASPETGLRAYVFRAAARPFGHGAPPRAVLFDANGANYTSYAEWELADPLGQQAPSFARGRRAGGDGLDVLIDGALADAGVPPLYQSPQTLYLDSQYKVAPSGWLVLERAASALRSEPLFVSLVDDIEGVAQVSLTAYGISGKATRIDLAASKPWLANCDTTLAPLRQTLVHCESEELMLAEEPITDPIGGGSDWIDLDGLYSGLASGRWVMVEGEREDVTDELGARVAGVRGAELAMIAEVVHRVKELPADAAERPAYGPATLPGDRRHTFIRLTEPLAYAYRRDTASIHGNVVKANHGETRTETLGGGDAAKPLQSFELKQTPLTYVPAPTPAGAESTLKVYVDDVQWVEAERLHDLGAADRGFVARTGDAGKTSVVFGNGVNGARLPTGIENVRAVYRSGIGSPGNVAAGQISQLASRPLGVKGVVNPLRATGGGDREDRDTARENAPRTVTALDRLVSVSDYADFARTFAGIGKAVAATVTDGRREWVHLTIAGADDIPIDETSDLHRNLRQALADYGEPDRPVAVQAREALLLVIGARVRIHPDRLWEHVAAAIRARLLEALSFARRALGQDLAASEVIAAIQAVPGVAAVDLDVLGGLPEKKTDTDADGRPTRRLLTPLELAAEAAAFLAPAAGQGRAAGRVRAGRAGFEAGAMHPAQIAYLTPRVPDTLVLNQIRDPAGSR